MIAFFVFITAFFLVTLAARLKLSASNRSGFWFPWFVPAIILAGGGGWIADTLQHIDQPLNIQRSLAPSGLPMASPDTNQAEDTVTQENAVYNSNLPTRRGIPADGYLFLIAAVLGGLSALRVRLNQPAWLADIKIVIASVLCIAVLGEMRRVYSESPLDGPFFGFTAGHFALTLFLMWAITRLTATLNRVPQASGGYFGIVALFVLLFLQKSGSNLSFFPFAAGAAMAGAGLATVPVALKNSQFNLGWPAAFTAGFMLSQAVVFGLPDSTVPTAFALCFLILALPLVDVLFYRVRGNENGPDRLHQGLQGRGISPTKIAFLYCAMGLWLAILGYLLLGLSTGGGIGQTIARLFALLFIGASGFLLFYSVARILMRRALGEEIPVEIQAFGVKVSAVTMQEALEKIQQFIASRQPHHVVTCDANAILQARQDTEYANIVRNAALATPDGYGVIWGMRLLNYPIYERVTGVDMVTGICEFAAGKNYSIYILGSEPGENGEPGVAAIAAQNLAEKYPGLRIAGTHHGFWRRDAKQEGISTEEADIRMAEQVREAAPDVLFVAMGIPMQEKFIAAQLQRLNVPVSLGVGGSFDVYSGKFERAPQWVQRIGLEWLYRVFIDPSRWKRMGYVPRFMLLAIKVWLSGKKHE
jgi:N-acetylglucosaminyldiphosphoundecaprenol N-acetyl-beta-D-mannosaminyltransferase